MIPGPVCTPDATKLPQLLECLVVAVGGSGATAEQLAEFHPRADNVDAIQQHCSGLLTALKSLHKKTARARRGAR